MSVLFWLLVASQATLCRFLCLSQSCYCGYGALYLGENFQWACSPEYCSRVSGGFYEEDCSTIVNHCLSSPCLRGKCVRTFGSYFCECPEGFVGKQCDIPRADFSDLSVSSKFYVYYQVQSWTHGERVDFHLIYDSLPQSQLEKGTKTGSRVFIRISDGRLLFPNFNTHFKKVDVKKRCLQETERHPDWQDSEVCALLPEGDVWTYTFNPAFEASTGDDLQNPDGEKMGETGKVDIFHIWVKDFNLDVELSHSSFTLFTYKINRIMNECKMSTVITFDGCANSRYEPYIYPRYKIIKITPIIQRSYKLCRGSTAFRKSWYIQRNVDEFTEFPDAEPIEYVRLGNVGSLTLPPHELPDGEHMIEYRISYRGDPPHYGGLSTFHSYGRCWIRVQLGELTAQMKGGTGVTASCYSPFELRVESRNPSYLPTELSFQYSCDHLEDKECGLTKSDVPVVKKLSTPCETTYEFNITVIHKLLRTTTYFFTATVHFKRIEFGFKLECLFNCFPIDVSWRMLVVASTEPYVGDSFLWKISAVTPEEHIDIVSNLPAIDAFWPLSTSRILRLDGEELLISDSPVQVLVQTRLVHWTVGGHFLTWTAHSMVINFCELISLPEGQAMFDCPEEVIWTYGSAEFSIVETNDIVKTNTEVLETHYLEKLVIQPVERNLQLCLLTQTNIHVCSRHYEFEGELVDIDIIVQAHFNAWSSSAVQPLLRLLSLFLYVNVVKPNVFSWDVGCEERKKFMDRLLQVEHWQKPAYVSSACNIISMIFYSKAGNRIENISEFEDEIETIGNYQEFEEWRAMRTSAMRVLTVLSQWAYKFAVEDGVRKLPTFSYGNMLDVLLRTWSLAHLQGTTDPNYLYNRFKYYSQFQWLLTSMEFNRQTDNKVLFRVAYAFSQAIARFANLFYGIRTYGKHHVRAWSLRTTYRGIIQSFNKSRRGETQTELANHIFAPLYPGSEWVDEVNVKLPKGRILPGKELCLAVFLVRNRPGDDIVSPTLFLYLADSTGEVYTSLPHKEEFIVTLPVLIGQSQPIFQGHFFSATLIRREELHKEERSEEERNFNIFKIVLPGLFQEWQLRVFLRQRALLKLAITSGTLPSFDNVNKLKSIETKLVPNSVDMYYLDYPVKPLPGSTQLPKYFYLAVMLDPSFPAESPIEVILKKSVDVCENRDPLLKRPKVVCKGLVRTKESDYTHRVDCVCSQFGFIAGIIDVCRITRVFTKPIVFVAPKRTFENHVLLFLTTIVTIIVMGLAYWKDRIREKRPTIQMIEDAKPSDQIPLILGVYTAKRFFSGTRSVIAIKVVGLSSSSRVHLLKSKLKKTLQTANDDWFLITTNRPLGKIVSITMWSNYYQSSAWYCSRVLIYDIRQTVWYIVPVNSWLGLHPTKNTSRVMSLPARKISPLESKLKAMPNKFREHYVTEFRNTHFFWSQFWLHERNLSTHEEKSSIFLLKCFSMLFCVLLCVLVSPNTFSESLGDTSSEIQIERSLTADYIIMSCLVATCSYLAVLPFVLGVRVGLKSFVIQKKTTNSVYLESVHQKVEGQKVNTAVSGSVGKYDKSVAFVLDSDRSEGQQPLESVTKPPPVRPRVRKKRAAASHFNLKLWLKVLVGPTQFRAVNVNYGVFQMKMSRRKLILRVIVSVVLLFCLLSVYLIEEYTRFWDNYRLYGGICLLSLIIDLIIVDPLVILLKSAMNFIVLKTSNRELYLWSEDGKVSTPSPLGYEEYCKTAITKDYKPVLTRDIEKLREKSRVMNFVQSVVYYVVTFIVMAVCYNILYNEYDTDHYNTISNLQTTYASSKNFLTGQTTHADRIVDALQLEPFITSSFVNLVYRWSDGKPISKNQKRWCRDRVSKIRGGTSVIISLASTRKTNIIPYFFSKYYNIAVGSLDTSEVQTKPVVIDDRMLKYTIIDSQTTVRGKSGGFYKFVGHHFVAQNQDWSKYCVTMANLLIETVARNATEETPRAIILSSNFANIFNKRINTIDVVVEFLPAGVLSAKVVATSLKVFSKTYISNYIRRIFVLSFGVAFGAFVVVKILKTSFSEFRKSSFWKLVVMTSVIVVIITFFVGYVSKYKMMRRFFNAPSEVYVDLHQANALNYIDSAALSIFFLCLCIEFSILLRRLLVKHRFPLAMHDGLRSYLVVILMLFIYVRVLEICCRPLNPSARNFVLVNYQIKTVFPLKLDACMFEEFVLLALMFALLLSKFATAILVFHTDKAMEDPELEGKAWAWNKLRSRLSKKAPTTSEVDPDDRVVMRLMRRSRTKSVKSSIAEKTRAARLGGKIDFLKRIW